MLKHRLPMRRTPSAPILDVKAILSLCQTSYEAAQSAVESRSNLWDQVAKSLLLCEFLTAELDLEDYCEVYRKCLTHLTLLVITFRESGTYSTQELECAYNAASICENLMPRIYGCLAFACCIDGLAKVPVVMDFVRQLSTPLHIFLFYFAAIALYPKNVGTARQFTLDSYGKWSDTIAQVLLSHPNAEESVKAWVTSAVDATLRAQDQGVAAVETIVQSAIQNRQFEGVSLHIISALMVSLAPEKISVALPLVARFFTKMGVNERTRKLVQSWCGRAPNLADEFDFVIQTPFASEMGGRIFEAALEGGDLKVAKLCLCEWPTNDFFALALAHVGPRAFAEICPTLRESRPIITRFIDAIREPLPAPMIRSVMAPVLASHSAYVEHTLIMFLQTVKLDCDTIRELFASPFEFITGELITKVVECLNPSFTEVIGMFERAKGVDPAVRIGILCDRYQLENLDQFVDAVLSEALPDIVVGKVVERISKSQVSEDSCKKLFQACRGRIALAAFFALLAESGNEYGLATEALSRWVQLDGDIQDVRGRLDLYLNALKIVVRTTLPFKEVIVDGVISVIQDALHQCLQILCFPLASKEVIERWINLLSGSFETDNFSRFQTEVSAILDALKSLLEG
jgi:hypothetical protein